MNRLRWILTPPTFEGDAEKTRHAGSLHIGSILLFIFPVILICFNVFFGTQAEKSIIWVLGLIAVVQILVQWMIRSGYVNEASLILLTISWAAMTVISRNVDGVRDVAVYGYILILLASWYLLGWRIATIFTGAQIAAVWWLAYTEVQGYIVPSQGNPYRIALDLTVIFILVFLVVYFIIRALTNSLENAQREVAERLRIERALEDEQERLQLALQAARMGSWNWDIQTGAVSWSAEVAPLFGRKSEQFDGRYETYLSFIHPDDLSELQGAIKSALSGEITDYVVVHRSIWPNGEIHWLEGRGKVYRDKGGRPIRMAGTVVDVTTRKQAETERERLIQQLEEKNTELERFTYTVSHDLKSPLITISGFLGYLEQDALTGNTQKFQQDIHRIHEATRKMKHLLDELLELSRIGRIMNPPEELLFDEIVQEALERLMGQLRARNVTVKIASNLPKVRGDRTRLVEVVQNLMDNAIKFMGSQTQPIIEIGVLQQIDKEVFFIKDNGIGIEPQYRDKIFELYEKLDHGSEGTGIGLALVKRIVNVHQGEIWVESQGKGTGATFYFTLPRQSSNKETAEGKQNDG